ncbi:MAG: glutamine-hydrolyzing carbamoyl-phosphate synthase small subunit [Thaumarchaeota archaeon]|nr:glutamine-hydrolyzing carbamoyl-phosphate synthase small subunit [Nitrososphaerota archaeon]
MISILKSKHANKFAKLVFDDDTMVDGIGFGYPKCVFGEIVFNTGMVGYTEAITDPSYNGQILTFTYPLIGNYGVPDINQKDENGIEKYAESNKIQVKGVVIHDLSLNSNHWNSIMTLDEWLYNEKIPGIFSVDTRKITKKLRKEGVMMCALVVSDSNDIDTTKIKSKLKKSMRYNHQNFMELVSTKTTQTLGQNSKNIVVIDTGTKNAILRNVIGMGYNVIKVPWHTKVEKILQYEPYGIIISNGPGDPKMCLETISTARTLLEYNIPILGICLGAQILALAGNARTYKLKYGHRSQNKPCLNVDNSRTYITSQNHGYCIDYESLKDSEFKLWFVNVDDKTVEGIKHKQNKSIAVQFHPEANPGPYDCKYVFNAFKKIVEENRSCQK